MYQQCEKRLICAMVPAENHFTKEDTIMALANIAGWAEENKAAAACGTACGASDK